MPCGYTATGLWVGGGYEDLNGHGTLRNGIAFQADSWLGLMGPAGIPDDISAKLNQEIAATLREPETRDRLAGIGLVVVASSPSELTEVLRSDVPKWGKAVKDSGAVAE